jgi:hypothetical protein
MRGFLKMCGLSAVLSFTLVTAYNQAWSSQPDAAGGKLFQDRLAAEGAAGARAPAIVAAPLPSVSAGRKGDRLPSRNGCADQTWPYLSPACLTAETGGAKPRAVRVITVETRQGTNTSVLARVPQSDIASR